MKKENIQKLVMESFSLNDLTMKIFNYSNKRVMDKISNFIIENEIDISHFGKGKKLEKYKIVNKICPICEGKFETKIGHRDEKTTCSAKCSIIYFQHGKNNIYFDIDKYNDRYIKISNTLLNKPKKNKVKRSCKLCGNDITDKPNKQIFCNNTCRSLYPVSDETKEKLSISMKDKFNSGELKGWQSRNIESYPETFFKKVLDNNGIKYEFNKPIKKRDLGIDCNCNYFLDFYIEDKNIDLEIDGKQHNYREEHDSIRDRSLIENGYDVYRIKWKTINTKIGKEYMKNEIDKFISYYMLK